MKERPTKWEKYLHIINLRKSCYIFWIYKEFIQLQSKKKSIQLQMDSIIE